METQKTEAAFKPRTVQLGIIVRDLEKAQQDYSALLNIGPWETVEVPEMNCRASFTMLGPVEVELIQPLLDENSLDQFFGDSQASFNHVGFWVDDHDEQIARFEGLGVEFAHKGMGKELNCAASVMNMKNRAGMDFELLTRLPDDSTTE